MYGLPHSSAVSTRSEQSEGVTLRFQTSFDKEVNTPPQYYREILGRNPGYLFQPSFGLLLRDDLHHGFDRGSIALYPSVRTCRAQSSCSAMC